MLISEMEEIFYNRFEKNIYTERYFKLLRYCIFKERHEGFYCERHHALPKSIFPKYKNRKEFVIKMTGRSHYLCHYLLAKGTDNDSMWFAFNQMKRIIPDNAKNCSLYSKNRIRISMAISKSNSGRKMSYENKQLISRLTKNTLVVKDENNNCFRISKNNPSFKNGEYKFYRVGYKHNDETILKMKNNSWTKGKIVYHNPKTGKHYWFFENTQPENFVLGYSQNHKNKLSSARKGNMFWYHDPITKKNIRCKKGENPIGYKLGRIESKGFSIINSKIKVLDLIDKRYKLVDKLDDNMYYAPPVPKKLEKVIIFIFQDKIFTSVSMFLKYMGLTRDDIDLNKDDFVVKKGRSNYNYTRKKFHEDYQGMKISDIGIKKILLKDLTIDDIKNKEIIWI